VSARGFADEDDERAAFVVLCAAVDAKLPAQWEGSAAILFALIQMRWEQSEAEDGETFVDFLRAYADVLEDEDGPAAQPVYPSRTPVPGPETLS
jgi:hypothetical protein